MRERCAAHCRTESCEALQGAGLFKPRTANAPIPYDPDNAECLAAQTICDFIEHSPNATSHGLQQLLIRHPQSVRTLVLVIIALERRGDIKEARRVAQQLVRARPDNGQLVAIARQLKINSHWSLLPLWPMQRFGWGGSVAIWLIGALGLRALARVDPQLAGTLTIVLLVYAAYSWIWPPILKRLIRA